MRKNNLGRFRKGCLLIVAVLCFHILLGLAAILGSGYFLFGATAPERYLLHYLSGDERHITFSGAISEFIDDICLADCDGCKLSCYPKSDLKLLCNESCAIYTLRGTKVASERQRFKYVVKNALLIEDSQFMCYNRTTGDCGFTVKLDENYTYSYNLPPEMKAFISPSS